MAKKKANLKMSRGLGGLSALGKSYMRGMARGKVEAIERSGPLTKRRSAGRVGAAIRREQEKANREHYTGPRRCKSNPKKARKGAKRPKTTRTVRTVRTVTTTRENPMHMLGVTALVNPTLQEGAEKWARARGLKVPARGSAAFSGLFQAWQRAGMPLMNPVQGAATLATCRVCGSLEHAKKLERGVCGYCREMHKGERMPAALYNPKKKRKTKKKGARKNPSAKRKRFIRYGDLPAKLKKKLRKAALLAAKRDHCALEDVKLSRGKSPAPAPHGLVNQGELLAVEYASKKGGGSVFAGHRWRHASGDRGRGKKKGRRQVVGVDPVTRQWIPVSRRGSRPGYSSQRGLIG